MKKSILCIPLLPAIIFLAQSLGGAPDIIALTAQADTPRPTTWTAYKNVRFGFELYYPSDWFKPGEPAPEGNGQTFISNDGEARISAFGMLDPKWYGAELFDKKKIVGEGRIYDELALGIYEGDLRTKGQAYSTITEKRVQDYSITLTGKRGDRLYFEKFIFSCKDKVINVLSVTYDESARTKYEPLIKKLVRRFHDGSGSDVPFCTDG